MFIREMLVYEVLLLDGSIEVCEMQGAIALLKQGQQVYRLVRKDKKTTIGAIHESTPSYEFKEIP